MDMIKKRIIIKGRKAHNIGYRFLLYDEALRLGLPYFDARNIQAEPEVINIHVGGEKGKIKLLTAYAKNNFPPLAEVTGVTEEPYPGDIGDIELFERSFMLEQQSKATSYVLDILTTLKSMDRTMTGMDEKQDKMIVNQGKMLQKEDRHIEISHEILRESKKDLKAVLMSLKALLQGSRKRLQPEHPQNHSIEIGVP